MEIPLRETLLVAMGMAHAEDKKLFVTADDEVIDYRPLASDLMYEVYPGGRIIAWGLADPNRVQSISDFSQEDQDDYPMLADHCKSVWERSQHEL